jgi:hypothetical protein
MTMDAPDLMLECLKLAVPVCLATQDKSAASVVSFATELYNAVNTAGKTSPNGTLSSKPKR